jgi:oligopeptide/dipeptide ABC transporter ATP-binding protein
VTPLLNVRGLRIGIGEREVVTHADLTVRPGECVAVVGESGCGKSMTCRAVMGLLDRVSGRVTGGELRLGDRDLAAMSAKEWRALRRGTLGFVPQSSMAGLDPVMRVGRQIRETVKTVDPQSDPRARTLELLESVRLPDPERVAHAYPHELSGGMRQRAMIALAMAGRPALLVADEPTTALDASVQKAIMDLLDQLRRDTGMAVVLISHDLRVVRSSADRIHVMYAGTTVEQGPTETVIGAPRHPYTRALIDADPSLGGVGERPASIPGSPPDPASWDGGCRFADRCGHAEERCGEALPAIETTEAGGAVACRRWRELSL